MSLAAKESISNFYWVALFVTFRHRFANMEVLFFHALIPWYTPSRIANIQVSHFFECHAKSRKSLLNKSEGRTF